MAFNCIESDILHLLVRDPMIDQFAPNTHQTNLTISFGCAFLLPQSRCLSLFKYFPYALYVTLYITLYYITLEYSRIRLKLQNKHSLIVRKLVLGDESELLPKKNKYFTFKHYMMEIVF